MNPTAVQSDLPRTETFGEICKSVDDQGVVLMHDSLSTWTHRGRRPPRLPRALSTDTAKVVAHRISHRAESVDLPSPTVLTLQVNYIRMSLRSSTQITHRWLARALNLPCETVHGR